MESLEQAKIFLGATDPIARVGNNEEHPAGAAAGIKKPCRLVCFSICALLLFTLVIVLDMLCEFFSNLASNEQFLFRLNSILMTRSLKRPNVSFLLTELISQKSSEEDNLMPMNERM